MRRSYIPVLVTLVMLSLGAVFETRAQDSLRDLRSADELKAAFNDDAGSYRLVLLLSPT